MSATRVFVARLAGCSVFDPAGDRVGKVRDVIVVYRKSDAPSVVGLLVEIPGKRRVFLSIGRVTSIGSGQIITTGLINLRRFEQRGGEVRVIAELLGRRMMFRDGSGEATIEDVAIEESAPAEWSVGDLFLRRPATTPFGKGATVFATWDQVREKNAPGESQSAEQLIATYSDLRPADLANTLLDLPEERRLEVAEELPDERLADALEEMPEQEQVELISQATAKRDYYYQSPLGCRVFELGLGPLALGLCGASGPVDQARIDRALAEAPPGDFAATFLNAKGLSWAAELLARWPGPVQEPLDPAEISGTIAGEREASE